MRILISALRRLRIFCNLLVFLSKWSVFFKHFFALGYLIPSDNRFFEAIKRCSWNHLILGIIAFAAVGYLYVGVGNNPDNGFFPMWAYFCFQIVKALGAFSWCLFFLGLAGKYLNSNSKVVTFGNEAVLPFYILHQTIIFWIGSFIIPIGLSISMKYMSICVQFLLF
jgi:hypothetical protein